MFRKKQEGISNKHYEIRAKKDFLFCSPKLFFLNYYIHVWQMLKRDHVLITINNLQNNQFLILKPNHTIEQAKHLNTKYLIWKCAHRQEINNVNNKYPLKPVPVRLFMYITISYQVHRNILKMGRNKKANKIKKNTQS